MSSVWHEEYKTKHGKNWVVRWEFYVNGKRYRGSETVGPSKAHMFEREKQIRDDLYAGKLDIKPKVELVTVDGFAAEYLSNRQKTAAENTYRNWDKPAVSNFAAWMGPGKLISMVEPKTLFEWRDHLLEADEYGVNTVRGYLRHLSSALSYAASPARRYLSSNPFELLEKKADLFPPAEEVARYVTAEEIEKLLPALPRHIAAAVYFILHTMLRHGELLGLDWKTIHRPASGPWVMEIARASAHGIGGGRQVKNRTSREVEIPDSARTGEVIGEPKESGKVFAWNTRDVIESSLRVACEKLGLGRIRTHDFRHTAATNFMYRTGNVFELMYRGGWKSMTSAKVYQHVRKRGETVEYLPFPQYFPNKQGSGDARQ